MSKFFKRSWFALFGICLAPWIAIMSVSSCQPRQAKTALDAVNRGAQLACETVFEEQKKLDKYCRTLEDLQPFIEAIQLAKAQAEGKGQGPEGSDIDSRNDNLPPDTGMAAE